MQTPCVACLVLPLRARTLRRSPSRMSLRRKCLTCAATPVLRRRFVRAPPAPTHWRRTCTATPKMLLYCKISQARTARPAPRAPLDRRGPRPDRPLVTRCRTPTRRHRMTGHTGRPRCAKPSVKYDVRTCKTSPCRSARPAQPAPLRRRAPRRPCAQLRPSAGPAAVTLMLLKGMMVMRLRRQRTRRAAVGSSDAGQQPRYRRRRPRPLMRCACTATPAMLLYCRTSQTRTARPAPRVPHRRLGPDPVHRHEMTGHAGRPRCAQPLVAHMHRFVKNDARTCRTSTWRSARPALRALLRRRAPRRPRAQLRPFDGPTAATLTLLKELLVMKYRRRHPPRVAVGIPDAGQRLRRSRRRPRPLMSVTMPWRSLPSASSTCHCQRRCKASQPRHAAQPRVSEHGSWICCDMPHV